MVEGSGDFPMDMLRYDSAFPATEHDSAIAQNYHDRRSVALLLRGVNDSGPTVRRWSSFTWQVVDIFSERGGAEDCRKLRQYNLEIERQNREKKA